VYVVEFQKMGSPRDHFLITMHKKFKLTCPKQYDLLISAELPNKKKYPELHKMVMKHMMQGPGGSLNLNCLCTKGHSSCKNHHPCPFCEAALEGKDSTSFIGEVRMVARKKFVAIGWAIYRCVPYLLQLLNYHINVEICGSIKSVKYLFKYIYKGHDCASVAPREVGKADDKGINKIEESRDAWWVPPLEVLWRIYIFNLSKIYPPIQ
jgi:hypothetical protein